MGGKRKRGVVSREGEHGRESRRVGKSRGCVGGRRLDE